MVVVDVIIHKVDIYHTKMEVKKDYIVDVGN